MMLWSGGGYVLGVVCVVFVALKVDAHLMALSRVLG